MTMQFIYILASLILICQSFDIQPLRTAPPNFVKKLIARTQRHSKPYDGFFAESSESMKHNTFGLHPSARQNEQSSPSPEVMSSDEPKTNFDWMDQLLDLFGNGSHNAGMFPRNDNQSMEQCHPSSMSPNGTVAIAWNYTGQFDSCTFANPSYSFFRYALGFTEKQGNESIDVFLKHLKDQFDFNFDLGNATFREEHGSYTVTMNEGEYELVPFVNTFKTNILAYSRSPTKCTDISAITGGWTLGKKNSRTMFTNMFFVFVYGSQLSTRIGVYPMTSTEYIGVGSFPITTVAYNFDDDVIGWMDGLCVGYLSDDNVFSNFFRAIFMWPGRFPPILP